MSSFGKRNINETIVAHLNVNSLRNKFDSLAGQMTGNIDILMVSDVKLDESFLISQFIIKGFGVPYRVDRNANVGGIVLLVREEIH